MCGAGRDNQVHSTFEQEDVWGVVYIRLMVAPRALSETEPFLFGPVLLEP